MTQNPIFCLPGDTITKVAQLMKARDIGSVPVIESEKSRKLVGIITDRDLVIEVLSEKRDPQTTRVDQVMTPGVLTCRIDDDLNQVMDAMSGYQLRRIPIVDDEDRLVGIISQADIATRVDQPESTAAVVKEISQAHVYLMSH
jgi:CBS domain-containing protein